VFRSNIHTRKTLESGSKIAEAQTSLEQQRQVCELSQSPENKGLQRINEEIVNSSLLSFLMAVCQKHPNIKARWTPQRAPLTAKFRKADVECLLDGFLASYGTFQTQVIVEAKAERRSRHSPQVSMQESAELLAAPITVSPKDMSRDR
jgi:DNA polymerase sigma